MSFSGNKGSSSSGSRGNPPNGRKRKLSSRSRSLNTLHNSSSNTRTITSYSVNRGGKGKANSSSPRAKKGRFVSDESSSSSSSYNSEPMAFPSTSGTSPFGNNFKGGGVNNHKRPGQGKKIVIKNRKGKYGKYSSAVKASTETTVES